MINLIYERNGIQYSWLHCKSKKVFEKMFKSLGEIKVIRIWED